MKAFNYSMDDVDRTEEVANQFTQLRQETVNEVNALQVQIDELRTKMTKKAKNKGFVGLKTLIATALIVLFVCSLSFGAIDWMWEYGTNPDFLDAFMRNPKFPNLVIEDLTMDSLTLENGGTFANSTNKAFTWTETATVLEDIIWTFGVNSVTVTSTTGVVLYDFALVVPKADQFLFDPVTDPVGSVEGTVYYDSDDDNLYVRTTAGLVDLTAAASGSTLDAAYDSGGAGAGAEIDAADGAITFSNNDADAAAILAISHTGAAAGDGIVITLANGTSDGIEFENTGTGYDIEGTAAVWYVDVDGSIVAPDLDLTGAAGLVLSNDETITNATDTEIRFFDVGSNEDFIFDLNAGTNAVGLKSGTGVDELAMGTIDDLTGVGTIVMDAAAASITLTADSGTEDFTITQAGGVDASLILSSAGTTGDALQITTTAGGIDITNGGAAGGEDIDIDGVLASVNINADEDVADAITIGASTGGIDITADGAADKDLDLVNTNGSVNISGGEAIANAVVVSAGAGGVDITSASTFDIDLTATGGKVLITGNEGAAGAVTLTTAGGGSASETIIITNDTGTSVTEGAAAIGIVSDVGGVELRSTANLANAIALTVDNDTTSSILVFNDTGTSVTDGAASIQLLSDLGGISAKTAVASTDAIVLNATAGGINVDAYDDINITLTSGTAGEDLTIAVAGSLESSLLMSSIGVGTDAISMQVTGASGGIDIDTTNDGVIDVNASDNLNLSVYSKTAAEDILITMTTTEDSVEFLLTRMTARLTFRPTVLQMATLTLMLPTRY